MSFYRGITCENVTLKGDKGTPITAYVAKPSGPDPFPGVVLVHHLRQQARGERHTRRADFENSVRCCARLLLPGRIGKGEEMPLPACINADHEINVAALGKMRGDERSEQNWERLIGRKWE